MKKQLIRLHRLTKFGSLTLFKGIIYLGMILSAFAHADALSPKLPNPPIQADSPILSAQSSQSNLPAQAKPVTQTDNLAQPKPVKQSNPVIKPDAPSKPNPKLAIVIDDVGNNRMLGQRIVDLPAAITVAILPHRAFSELLANNAHKVGKEIILHSPMANLSNKSLGEGALTPYQNEAEFRQALSDSIHAVPHLVGINNHMGSLLTQQSAKMKWVMDVLKKENLFFIDSLTTAKSVAWKEAKKQQIPYAIRNVFLDNDKSEAALQKQFDQAIKQAKRNGHAILIGHPYKETSAFLVRGLAQLKAEGIDVVSVSTLLKTPSKKATKTVPMPKAIEHDTIQYDPIQKNAPPIKTEPSPFYIRKAFGLRYQRLIQNNDQKSKQNDKQLSAQHTQ
jgi:polysaccharide deacetylase 2 family uncharacterized protein YibQ